MPIKAVEILAEIEDLLRTLPSDNKILDDSDESLSWFGRAMAVLGNWDSMKSISAQGYIDGIQGGRGRTEYFALKQFKILLHQARNDLRMKTVGPISTVVPTEMVFDYFDEVRQVIETANTEIFFIDPYLNAEFISRYLTQVSSEVSIRLLANKYINALVPAAQVFIEQYKVKIEIRSHPNFHDRFLFIDRSQCYLSGASFKDGPRNAPATFTQIIDGFDGQYKTYEEIWNSAKPEL